MYQHTNFLSDPTLFHAGHLLSASPFSHLCRHLTSIFLACADSPSPMPVLPCPHCLSHLCWGTTERRLCFLCTLLLVVKLKHHYRDHHHLSVPLSRNLYCQLAPQSSKI